MQLQQARNSYIKIAMTGIARHLAEKSLVLGTDYTVDMLLALRFGAIRFTGLNSTKLAVVKRDLDSLNYAAQLEENKSIRISTNYSRVIFDIPFPSQLHIPLTSSQLPRANRSESFVGVGLHDRKIGIDLLEPGLPHALFAGSTQSGKTTAAMVYTWGLAMADSPGKLLLFDVGKDNRDWYWLDRSKFLIHPVVTSKDNVQQVFDWLDQELNRRQARPRDSFEPLYLIIDELKDMIDNYPQCVPLFSSIGRKGATYNMHLVCITQYTQDSVLGPEASELKKLLIGYRMIGQVDNAKSAASMTGVPESGAEKLDGVGDFIRVKGKTVDRLSTANFLESDKVRIPRLESPNNLFNNPVVLESDFKKPERQEPQPEINIKALAAVVHLWSANKRPPGLEKIRKYSGLGTHEEARQYRIKAGQFLYFYNRKAIGEGGFSAFDDVKFDAPNVGRPSKK